MSAETLWHAARLMRADKDPRWAPVADWLGRVAYRDEVGTKVPDWSSAFAVASTYIEGNA